MALVVKNPSANAGDLGLILDPGDPLGRKWHPTPIFLPGKFQGQRSQKGYSPWGCKELDTTEGLNTRIFDTPATRANRKKEKHTE